MAAAAASAAASCDRNAAPCEALAAVLCAHAAHNAIKLYE